MSKLNHNAYEFLRSIQKEEGIKIKPLSFDRFKAMYASNPVLQESLRTVPEKQRTKTLNSLYQQYNDNPLSFFDPHLVQLKQTLLQYCDKKDQYLLDCIPVGSLATFDVNAWTMPSPDETPIVVVHYGFMGFAQDLSRLFAAAAQFQKIEHVENPDNFYEMGQKSIRACFTFLTDHNFSGRFVELSEKESSYASSIRDSIELFVLAHEFGHIVLGHHNDAVLSSDERSHAYYVRSQEAEHEADLWATKLLFSIPEYKQLVKDVSLSSTCTCCGGLLALAGMSLLEKVADHFDELRKSVFDSPLTMHFAEPTHPPTKQRIARVLEFHRLARPKDQDNPEDIVAYFDILFEYGYRYLIKAV